MNHMKYIYIYTQKSQEYFINGKVWSSYVQCTLEEIQEPIPIQQLLAKHDVQSNKIKENIHIKKIHIIQYTLTFIINESKMFP